MISNSVALYTDVVHLFSDLSGFGCSLIALQIVKRKPNLKYSFGYVRAEALGALFSLSIMYIMTIYVGIEAFSRLI